MSEMVDRARWARRTIFEQMGNIYADVGRSIAAWKRGDKAAFKGALNRALDMFDATAEALVRQKPHRAREVLRAKEQYLQLFFGDAFNEQNAANLEQYFYHYALAARLHR